MAFIKTCGKYSLLVFFIWLILSACGSKNSQVIVIHLVPFNYEGVLIESLQLDGQLLQRSGDTIFIHYDEKGIAIYRDTIVHFSGIQEKYFYAKDGKISSTELLVDPEAVYHGMCGTNPHPFYSVVVSRNYASSLNFKKEQKRKVEEYICDK